MFLQPGHRFQVVDALLTNFHLPRTPLLALVSAFAGRELYWWCPSKMMDSPVDMKAVGKLLGGPSTSRNITTVRRLAAKYPPG